MWESRQKWGKATAVSAMAASITGGILGVQTGLGECEVGMEVVKREFQSSC